MQRPVQRSDVLPASNYLQPQLAPRFVQLQLQFEGKQGAVPAQPRPHGGTPDAHPLSQFATGGVAILEHGHWGAGAATSILSPAAIITKPLSRIPVNKNILAKLLICPPH